MRYRVFHSRTGAAALAAALRYTGEFSREAYFRLVRELPMTRQFVLCQQFHDETVLVAASGQEYRVLEHALTCLVEEFRPDGAVVLLHCHPELRHAGTRFWLAKHHLVPGLVLRFWEGQLWSLVSRQEGVH